MASLTNPQEGDAYLQESSDISRPTKRDFLKVAAGAAISLLAQSIGSKANAQVLEEISKSQIPEMPKLTPQFPWPADLNGKTLQDWFQERYSTVQSVYSKGVITSPTLIGLAPTDEVVDLTPNNLVSFNNLYEVGETARIFFALTIPPKSGRKMIVKWVHRTDGQAIEENGWGGRDVRTYNLPESSPTYRFLSEKVLEKAGDWSFEIVVETAPEQWKTIFSHRIIVNDPLKFRGDSSAND